MVHPAGVVLATCSGQRHAGDEVGSGWSEDEGSDSPSLGRSAMEEDGGKCARDNSLKVWAL